MTINSLVSLFVVMFVLAFMPSISVLTVSARSAAYGFIHGIFTIIGIIAGDIFFILLAIFGLTLLADAMGSLFVLVKYLGGAYLLWLGVSLWRSKPVVITADGMAESSLGASFLSGLFITLADQKAVLFYLGLFPAFIDLSKISYFDTGMVILSAITAIASAKLFYAFIAARASRFLRSARTLKTINIVAASVIIVVGLSLVLGV